MILISLFFRDLKKLHSRAGKSGSPGEGRAENRQLKRNQRRKAIEKEEQQMRKKLCSAVMVFILCIGLLKAASAAEVYTFGVVPQISALDIHKYWTPFLKELSSELNVTFQLKAYPSIPVFEQDLLKGGVDFAYMNPYHAVMAHKARYYPIVKDKTDLVGCLVSAKSSGFKSVKDLNGKLIVFPSPNAFASSLYMRALLSEKEKIHFSTKYVKTHQNVYKSVALGMSAAGGSVQNILDKEEPASRDKLMVLYETPGFASHPIGVHERVPSKFGASVQKAILKLAADPKNREMFGNIKMPHPVTADYKKDYLPLSQLGLEKYVEIEKD
jgi:phosphonate transport system substrate-binding protein